MAPIYLLKAAAVLAGIWLGVGGGPATGQDFAIGLATALKQRLDLFAIGAHNGASAVEPRLSREQVAALRALGADFATSGDEAALLSGWRDYVATNRPPVADIEPLVSLVLRECFRQASAEVKAYGEALRTATAAKAEPPGPKAAGGTAIVYLGRTSVLRLPAPADDPEALAALNRENPLSRQQQTIDRSAATAKTLRDAALAVLGEG